MVHAEDIIMGFTVFWGLLTLVLHKCTQISISTTSEMFFALESFTLMLFKIHLIMLLIIVLFFVIGRKLEKKDSDIR